MDIPTKNLLRSAATSPLGRLTLAGIVRHSGGTGPDRMRILGSHAIVYTLAGTAHYRDARSRAFDLSPGDLLFIRPDVPHTYAPPPGLTWSELYLVFDGPAFDLLPAPPSLVAKLLPLDYWHDRIRELCSPPEPGVPESADMLARVARTLVLLADITRQHHLSDAGSSAWLARATAMLTQTTRADQVDVPLVARALGMTYETFRKRYAALAGVSPGRTAIAAVIRRACSLMHSPQKPTNADLAAACGFCDEFHFSRRFKQILGVSPSHYRRRLPQ